MLPFKHGGGDAGIAAFADGMTDEIVTGLSRFSYLRVLSRGSTSRYAHEAIDVRSAGKDLGARYVMEGTLRQAGAKLRLAVQLVDAESGAHLWAETYSRPFRPEAVFELQDDLVPRIVSTVADPHGILPHTMSEGLRSKAPEELSPYEAVLRSFGYYERVTAEELAAGAIWPWNGRCGGARLMPMPGPCWRCSTSQEHAQGFNLQAGFPDGRALDAAQQAAELAIPIAWPYDGLAWALFFRKEYRGFSQCGRAGRRAQPHQQPHSRFSVT